MTRPGRPLYLGIPPIPELVLKTGISELDRASHVPFESK